MSAEQPTDYKRLSVMLYRSLERLSIAIESCAQHASPIIAREFAEEKALDATVWTDAEWQKAWGDVSGSGIQQISDYCRDKLATSWGYVKVEPPIPAQEKQP